MKNVYFILDKLNSEIDESFIVHTKEEYENNKEDICFSCYLPDKLFDNTVYYAIIGNGDYYKVEDIDKIKQSKEDLIEFGKNIVKKDIKSYENKAESYMRSKSKLNIIKGCVIKSTIFSIIEKSLTDNEETIKKDSIRAIIKEREDNFEIETELDYINEMINKCITEDKSDMNILECYYNGKQISSEKMISELDSHVFPQYINQKDITTTLSDYYCIKTNKGIILREKDTGKVIILSSDSKIPEEYLK